MERRLLDLGFPWVYPTTELRFEEAIRKLPQTVRFGTWSTNGPLQSAWRLFLKKGLNTHPEDETSLMDALEGVRRILDDYGKAMGELKALEDEFTANLAKSKDLA